MPELSVIGTSVVRVDALEKVTGQANYGTEMKLPGMLYGKILRSPHPHAKIISIDTSRAERLPGVRGIITGKDAPGRYGLHLADQYIPAKDVVRFVGEGVAAVAADSVEIAEEAIELIDVKYEPLPAMFDPEEAASTKPPIILHPDLFTDIKVTFPGRRPFFNYERPNVMNHFKIRHGDVERGFREADLIMENKFTTPRIIHSQIEPMNCVARAESDGGLTVWTSCQVAYRLRGLLCIGLGVPPSKVRVISGYIGGAFGGHPKAEQFAVLLARKTRRPVKITLTRTEMFSASNCRAPMVIRIKDGVKKDGTLVARQLEVFLNGGAYADAVPSLVRQCAAGPVPLYRVPNFKLDSYGVYTNNPVVGPFRGAGVPQPLWAVECHMDMIAERLGIDPVELRLKNFLKEGEENAFGERTHSIGAAECLKLVANWIQWGKKPERDTWPWVRGKGLAAGSKPLPTPNVSTAEVKIEEDGTIQLRVSADEIGQGADTVLSQIAAEEFGVSLDRVKVLRGDTATIPYAMGSVGSRTCYVTGNALVMACRDAKRQLFEVAAEKLEIPPEELDTRDGKVFVKDAPEVSIGIPDLFSYGLSIGTGYVRKSADILGKGVYEQRYTSPDRDTGQSDKPYGFYTYGAQATEVAVNVETGAVRVLKFGSAFDMGRAINPKLCEGQIEGGMGMGIGSALFEEMIMENGKVLNPGFLDYRFPTIKEIPSGKKVASMLAPVPHEDGPYGIKGLGEGVLAPTAPAIGNAIYNAVGVRVNDLPITTERVLEALREKDKASQ